MQSDKKPPRGLKTNETHILEVLREGQTEPNLTPQELRHLTDAVATFVKQRGFQQQIDNFIRTERQRARLAGPKLRYQEATIRLECRGAQSAWTAHVEIEGDDGRVAKSRTTPVQTTAQRAELSGLTQALRRIDAGGKVTVVVESHYLRQAIQKRWPERWATNGWTRRDGQPVKNLDLWRELTEQLARWNPQDLRAEISPKTNAHASPSSGSDIGNIDLSVRDTKPPGNEAKNGANDKAGEMRNESEGTQPARQ